MKFIIIELQEVPEFDFEVISHGSVVALTPLTSAAEEWVKAHVSEERTYFGDALIVELRYIGAILDGIGEAGLTYLVIEA